MSLSLSQLLRNAYQVCVSRWKPLLLGAVLFGTLSAVVMAVTNRSIEGHIWESMNRVGFDREKMMELQLRLQSGDEEAVAEAMAELEVLEGQLEGMTPEQREQFFATEGMAMFKRVLPFVSINLLVGFAIMLLAQSYFLLLGLGRGKDAIDLLNGVPKKLLGLLGVWVWMFLRSFAWIPILGLIPAIILGPRFALAPVILLEEGKGVRQSVQESYVRTQGYWGKVAGNGIVAGVIVLIALAILNILGGFFEAMIPELGLWYSSVLHYAGIGYLCVFLVGLARTIKDHPLQKG